MANRWIVYTLLILLRFYGACYNSLPGYIHPDEFFQGGQELFFGCQQLRTKKPTSELTTNSVEHKDNDRFKYVVDNIPWEFEPKNAIRSIVPPAFMTLLPLRVYSLLRLMIISFNKDSIYSPTSVDNNISDKSTLLSHDQLSGREILIIPRLFMSILSIIFLDGCLWMLVKYSNKSKGQSSEKRSDPPIEVFVLASSWPTLVMATRPFTNTLEAMVVSILLLIVAVDLNHKHDTSSSSESRTSQIQHWDQNTIPLMIGLSCSIGLFVRFTFAFFAMPIVLVFLYNRCRAHGNNWKKLGLVLLRLAISFITTSLLFVTIDWYYYHYLSPGRNMPLASCDNWSCYWDDFRATATNYVVPWNAFRYNSKATNLAEHGLHPRITHALVNMPMLFGPLSLIGYYSCIRKDNENGTSPDEICNRRVLCQSTIISGLLVLSCAPHQEPRFLLPCIVPLVFLYGRSVVGMDGKQSTLKQRAFLAVWLVFNSILYLFFGWLHQGGVISSLTDLPLPLDFHLKVPETVIYYKTYMPPTFLSRGRLLGNINEGGGNLCDAHDEERIVNVGRHISLACDNQVIMDLQGREFEVLMEVLKEKLVCNQSTNESVLFITPAPVMIFLADNVGEYTFVSINRHNLHVSTEDWPVMHGISRGFIDQLELVTYRVSCAAES